MKKVLSFVLVLSLVLSSFSMAFAGEVKTGLTDVKGTVNEEAINVVNNLGIVAGYPDGTFQADKAVTRAEFAVMLTKALAIPESALAGYTATSFTDVEGYDWAVPYLAFCESKGIMSGYGNGEVKPGNTITVSEAVAMALRAVGYTPNSSELVGTWPSNYVTLAQDKGLYEDVAATLTVDRGSAAQVIYNVLDVQKVQVATDGTTNPINNNGVAVNMLNSGLKCYTAGLAVVKGDEASLIDLREYVGAYANLVKNSDGKVVAVADIESVFITGDLEGTTLTTADDVEYTVSDSAIAVVIPGEGALPFETFANGVETADTTIAAKDGNTVTLAVELSGKTVKYVYSIATWNHSGQIFQFAEGDLEDDNIAGYEFTLDDNEEIDLASFELLGVKSLSDIEEDDVVVVYTEGTNSKVTKIEVGTETVTGTVSKISGTTPKYTINGKAYTEARATGITLQSNGTFYLTYGGEIAYFVADNTATGNYAVITATNAAASFGSTTYQVKLFTAAGETITVDVDDEVAGLTTSAIVTNYGKLVEYSLNKDGLLNKIDTAKVTAGDLNATIAKDNTLIGAQVAAENTVVFVVEADGSYSIDKLANLDHKNPITTTYYVKNTNNEIAGIVVSYTEVDNTTNSFGVINATSAAVDTDDTNVLYLDGYVNGKELSAFTGDTTFVAYSTTTTTAGLQKIVIDDKGVVTGVSGVVVGTDVDAYTTFAGATISAVDAGSRNFKIGANTYRVAPEAVIYVWDATDGEWVIKTMTALKGKYVHAYTTDADEVVGYDIILAWE